MPDLILARLFFNKIANKEKKNTSNQKVLKNYFRFNFNIFFEGIRQLVKSPENYYYLQKPSNLADQKLQLETDVLPQMGETSQNITFWNKSSLSFAPQKIYFFRNREKGIGGNEPQIYPYHYPQSMDLDQKPLDFFRSNIPPSSFKKCPGILQHLILHLISKSQKTDVPLLQHSRIIKNVFYRNVYKKEEIRKNILPQLSYFRMDSNNIALNYINPVNIGYIQRAFNAGKAGSINKAIHPLDREKNSLELPQEKEKTFFTGENIVTKKPDDALKQNNRDIKNITYGTIPKAIGKNILFSTSHSSANIALNYINPVNIGYIQRAFNAGKAGSINKAIHPLDREKNSLELSQEKEKTFFTGENIVTKKPDDALKQNNRDIKNITYGTIPKAIGKNILFSTSHSSANVALNYINPVNIGYIQRAFNAGKAGSITSPFHPVPLNNVMDSSGLSTRKISAPSIEKNEITKGGKTLLLKHRQYSEILFPDQGINGDYIMKKGRPVGSRDVAGDVTYGTKELVLKKTATRPSDVVSDNDNGQLRTDKIDHLNTSDNLVKEALKEKSAHEISKIADRVYKLIERKISIEKDRRGIF